MNRRAAIRLVAGLAAAALWLPLTLYVVGSVLERDLKPFVSYLIALYTIPLTATLAGPIAFAFSKHLTRTVCWTAGVLIGVVGGTVLTVVYGASGMTFIEPPIHIAMLEVFAAVGFGSGHMFWLVGVASNGDLTIVGGDRDA